MSPYFDGCYFDPTYFDAAPCAVAPAPAGRHNPDARRYAAAVAAQDHEEAWLLGLIDIPTSRGST